MLTFEMFCEVVYGLHMSRTVVLQLKSCWLDIVFNTVCCPNSSMAKCTFLKPSISVGVHTCL